MRVLGSTSRNDLDSDISQFFSFITANDVVDGFFDKGTWVCKARLVVWENIVNEEKHSAGGGEWGTVDANVDVRWG